MSKEAVVTESVVSTDLAGKKTNPVLKRISKIRELHPILDNQVRVDAAFTEFHKGLGGFERFNKADHDKFSQKNEDKPK